MSSGQGEGAGGQRALGRLLGVSGKTVNGWVHDARWTFGPGPWNTATVEKIRQWRRMHLAENPAVVRVSPTGGAENLKDLPIERRVKVGLGIERIEASKLAREIKKGEFHRVDECRNRRLRQIHEVKTDLLNLPDSLPVEASVKDLVRSRLEEICRKFAGQSL